MNGFDLLILTDHGGHTGENSLYALSSALARHEDCLTVDIASRAMPDNKAFFGGNIEVPISVISASGELTFEEASRLFEAGLDQNVLDQYDFVLLRLPPPYPPDLYNALLEGFTEDHIINNPRGIIRTSSKKFLLEVAELCPPMRLLESFAEMEEMAATMEIVVKPLNSYAGIGIVRVGETIETFEGKTLTKNELKALWDGGQPLLGMKFLKNVDMGDKRTIVVNGEVIGSSLRKPPPGSWMCNVAQGGTSVNAMPDEDELEIARFLTPVLRKHGVVIFGFDTLVDDDGRRRLSELNTTSIGGIAQICLQNGKSVDIVAELIMQHINAVWHGDA